MELLGIGDLRSFVAARLNKSEAFRQLTTSDQDDAISAMMEMAWKESQTYNATERGVSFSTHLARNISWRFIDHLRKHHRNLRAESQRDVRLEQWDDNEQVHWDHYEFEDDPPDERELLDGIDLDKLSLSGLTTLTAIAIPMRRGVAIETISTNRNVSEAWIRRRLRALQKELDA